MADYVGPVIGEALAAITIVTVIAQLLSRKCLKRTERASGLLLRSAEPFRVSFSLWVTLTLAVARSHPSYWGCGCFSASASQPSFSCSAIGSSRCSGTVLPKFLGAPSQCPPLWDIHLGWTEGSLRIGTGFCS